MAPAPQRPPSRTAPRRAGCLLIVAAAGYGKTTALEAAAGPGATAYHHAAALAGWAALPALDPAVTHLAVDGLCALPPPQQVAVARLLAAVPDRIAVSVAARRPPPAAVLAALPAPVTERGPTALALPPDAVARVLRDEHGIVDADLAYRSHQVTAGWPALVHFAGEALAADGAEPLPALTGPGAPAAAWVREHVLGALPPAATRLLTEFAEFDPICADLYQPAPGSPEPPWTAAPAGQPVDLTLRWLARVGLLTAYAGPGPTRAGSYRLVPVVAGVLLHPDRPTGQAGSRSAGSRSAGSRSAGAARVRRQWAARWYAAHGYPLAAARALHRAGDLAACADLIEARGDEILAAGGATELADLCDAIPAVTRTARLRLLRADALRMAGQVSRAAAEFAALLAAGPPYEPALAWRAAMAHYLRADHRGALAVLAAAAPAAGRGTADD
ncbi:MAG TPA: hypothetical protein VES42_11060, partial [Pilimelia sp.]|nr:hypothetical protein [Pilimelia sp.]